MISLQIALHKVDGNVWGGLCFYMSILTGKPTFKTFVNQEAEREKEKSKKMNNANELFEEQIMQQVSTSVAFKPPKKNILFFIESWLLNRDPYNGL